MTTAPQLSIEQARTREVFLRLAYQRPDDCEKVAVRANLCLDTHCRHCRREVSKEDADVLVGYWVAIWFIAHKECVKPGKAEEAYECQKIDADCNDCTHFRRGKHNKRFSSESLLDRSKYAIFTGNQEADAEEQKRYIKDGGFVGSYDGHCLKFDKPTTAWPKQATMHPCFEHRKDGVQS